MATRQKIKEKNSSQNEGENTDALVKLTSLIQELKADQAKLAAQVDKQGAEMSEEFKGLKATIEHSCAKSEEAVKAAMQVQTKVTALQNDLNTERIKNAKLDSKVNKMQEHIIRLESQSRRDNLLFDGVQESPQENCLKVVQEILKSKLLIDNADSIQIVRCHRLGPVRSTSKKPRTIIAKFHWYGDRTTVWNAKKNLKGSNIFLREDFPTEIQNRRRILWPIMKKAQSMGKSAFLNVDALIIDGRRYTCKDINTLPPDLDPAKIATPQAGHVTAFFGGQSPLSNFYNKSTFQVEGVTYDCVERYYTKCMAQFAGDCQAEAAVMEADTPWEIKTIGSNISKKMSVIEWRKAEAEKAMRTAVKHKFEQDDYLKKFLIDTKDTLLAEANPKCTFWGIGISLKEHDKFKDPEKWPAKDCNLLGKILMDVRNSLNI